jgi:hypothetical protein
MAAAADLTHHSIQAIAIFAPDAWHKELNPYFSANLRAMQRGVVVKRLFVIPKGTSDTELESYIQVMTEQSAIGMKIYYGFQTEVEPFYQNHIIYPCAFFDDNFFGYDLRTDIMRKGFPDISRFTWDGAEIAEKCPFPDLWKFHAVLQFDSQSPNQIRDYFKKGS